MKWVAFLPAAAHDVRTNGYFIIRAPWQFVFLLYDDPLGMLKAQEISAYGI